MTYYVKRGQKPCIKRWWKFAIIQDRKVILNCRKQKKVTLKCHRLILWRFVQLLDFERLSWRHWSQPKWHQIIFVQKNPAHTDLTPWAEDLRQTNKTNKQKTPDRRARHGARDGQLQSGTPSVPTGGAASGVPWRYRQWPASVGPVESTGTSDYKPGLGHGWVVIAHCYTGTLVLVLKPALLTSAGPLRVRIPNTGDVGNGLSTHW